MWSWLFLILIVSMTPKQWRIAWDLVAQICVRELGTKYIRWNWIRHIGGKPLHESMQTGCQLNSQDQFIMTFYQNILSSSPPGHNDRHLADEIFICIFTNEKFVSKSSIDNKLALVRDMAWRRTGDKPLSIWVSAAHFPDAYAALRGYELNFTIYSITMTS